MQITSLKKQFDKLQPIFGDENLDAIYGAGEIKNPRVCLVFMNPTARNVSANKKWKGLKAPWVGTKNVWKMFFQLGLLDKELFQKISARKPSDWDYEFATEVYRWVQKNSIYITNLSKATQIDARPLTDEVFKKYLDLFEQEISAIKPVVIITFGNQVSSILLRKNVKVSECRKRGEVIEVNGEKFMVYPVYYPVGQGTRNIKKAKEDISWIFRNSSVC
jgi:DNA polymerase